MIRHTVAALKGAPSEDAVQWLINRELVPHALGMLMVQSLPKGAELKEHCLPGAESVTFVLLEPGRSGPPTVLVRYTARRVGPASAGPAGGMAS